MPVILLHVAGAIAIALAAMYPIYPRRFRWSEQLQRTELLTRQIFWVHCGFIVMLLALQGVLLLLWPGVLLEPSGAAIALLAGLAAFWGYRLFAQLFIYDASLWRGNRLHTIAHIVFTAIWVYMTAVSTWALVDVARSV